MEKDEFLKTRVSKRLKVDFDDICRTYGKQPTVQLREMVDDFVRRERHRLGDRVLINIFKPDRYEVGAWRVMIKLRDPEALVWAGQPVPFELPELSELPNRRIDSDSKYRAILMKAGGECRMGGKFVDGIWEGDLYTNGCPEAENPTPIEDVRSELLQIITELLDRFELKR